MSRVSCVYKSWWRVWSLSRSLLAYNKPYTSASSSLPGKEVWNVHKIRRLPRSSWGAWWTSHVSPMQQDRVCRHAWTHEAKPSDERSESHVACACSCADMRRQRFLCRLICYTPYQVWRFISTQEPKPYDDWFKSDNTCPSYESCTHSQYLNLNMRNIAFKLQITSSLKHMINRQSMETNADACPHTPCTHWEISHKQDNGLNTVTRIR